MSSSETSSDPNYEVYDNEVEDDSSEDDLVQEVPVNVGRQIPDEVVPIVNLLQF